MSQWSQGLGRASDYNHVAESFRNRHKKKKKKKHTFRKRKMDHHQPKENKKKKSTLLISFWTNSNAFSTWNIEHTSYGSPIVTLPPCHCCARSNNSTTSANWIGISTTQHSKPTQSTIREIFKWDRPTTTVVSSFFY